MATEPLKDTFQDKALDPNDLSWREEYRGKEGYLRMYREVMDSFYTEFPELRGKVTAFNFAEPVETEMQRMSEYLSVPRKQFGEEPSTGEATTHYVPIPPGGNATPGRIRSVAWGIDPVSDGAKWDDVTPQDIDGLAWHLTHELFHTADIVLNVKKNEERTDFHNHSRWFESFADAGRLSLYLKNYGGSDIQNDALKLFSVVYDLDRPLSPEIPEKIVNRPGLDPVAARLNRSFVEKYDNGELLHKVYNSTQTEHTTRSYAMKGWRATFDDIDARRAAWDDLKGDHQLKAATATIMKEAADRFKEEASQDIQHLAKPLQDTYKVTPEKAVDELFCSRGLYRNLEKSREPAIDEASKLVMERQQQFFDWLKERNDFLPSVNRMLAAHDVAAGKTDKVGVYSIPVMSDLQGMSRAVSSYLHTGDPLDKKAAEFYSMAEGGFDVKQKQALLEQLYTDPQLRADLARGMVPIDRAPAPATPAMAPATSATPAF